MKKIDETTLDTRKIPLDDNISRFDMVPKLAVFRVITVNRVKAIVVIRASGL